ncbi:MAG: cytochrome c peroxidase [Pseudomonadota bacterium]
MDPRLSTGLVLAGLVLSALPAVAETALPAPISDADYRTIDPDRAALGQLLFYDPILSGNRNIACATCHHPRFGTADGVSLSFGEGGVGLGPERRMDPDNLPEQRIPRNAPGLFNLGAHEFTVMFHDGRLEVDPDRPGGMRTPLEADMVAGFDSVLSAQTMFPVLSADEMAGHYGENDVAKAVRLGRITGPGGAWDIIAGRVREIEEYVAHFATVEPEIAAGREIAFTDISNVIADFMALEWRADDSPFDRHLRGTEALAGPARIGMDLFYGKAQCAACHSGPFQTDHGFHALAVPQFGPGKAARFEDHSRDDGRARVTGAEEDRFRFRTPSLRNVALTAPYGHTGAFRTLEDIVAHHGAPADDYTLTRAVLPEPDVFAARDGRALSDAAAMANLRGVRDSRVPALDTGEIEALVAFLNALTDPGGAEGRLGIPNAVPSGLPIDR